jgi:hypothetical protein
MTPNPKASRARRTLLALAFAALVGACGGSTSQFESFAPERLFVFGDEASAFESDGRNWSVNGLNASSQFDCALLTNWVGQLATNYGFAFTECNPGNLAVRARNYAAPQARVADIPAQIDRQIAAGGFTEKDLVAFFVGINDVIDLYQQYPQRGANDLAAEAGARGAAAAAQVNRLVGLGAKVVLSNLPDLSLSPYAQTERANNGDIDRAALIARLTEEFNQQLGVRIILDGRFVGLAQLDQRTQLVGRAPGAFGVGFPTGALCTTPPPNCTTGTVTDTNVSAWLWSADRFMAIGGQNLLAALAIDRARRNPF